VTLALIALRNLGRNRRRTILSLLVAASGGTALVLTGGFIRFSFEGLRAAIVEGGLGHLEVAPLADFGGSASPLERSARPPALAGWERLREEIEGRPHVAAVGAAIQFAGMATHGDRSAAFLALAVEPDREARMGIRSKLRAGEGLAVEAPREEEVLLGVGLARVLGAGPGDTIALLATNSEGSLDALDVTVRGLITTGLQELDARLLKTHVVTAQRLLSTARVSSLIVGLDSADRTAAAQADVEVLLRARFPSLIVVDWERRAPFYRQVRSLYGAIFAFLGGVVLLLVVLSSSNTLLMSVLERVREFGTLRAIGTSKGQVGMLVVLEALWLGLISGIAGAVLGQTLALLINRLKLQMPPPPGAADPHDLLLKVQPSDLLAVVVFMVVLLGLASLFPMLRVVRLRIALALAHD
jgi:putative ABC transport system permease protein